MRRNNKNLPELRQSGNWAIVHILSNVCVSPTIYRRNTRVSNWQELWNCTSQCRLHLSLWNNSYCPSHDETGSTSRTFFAVREITFVLFVISCENDGWNLNQTVLCSSSMLRTSWTLWHVFNDLILLLQMVGSFWLKQSGNFGTVWEAITNTI